MIIQYFQVHYQKSITGMLSTGHNSKVEGVVNVDIVMDEVNLMKVW